MSYHETWLRGPSCYRCGQLRIAGVCSNLGCFEPPERYAALAADERQKLAENHDPGDEDRS